jgi:prepilin-type N-terminal cleavage/methylation domain-containing protein
MKALVIAARGVRGFTLIEIAVVLFISALVLGSAATMINSLMMNYYHSSLNTTFSSMQATATAFAVNKRIGWAGSWKYDLPTTSEFAVLLASGQKTDPWGTAIVYARNGAINPVGSSTPSSSWAITLTSYGPNKMPGGNDDIVRTVYVADLKSIFQLSGW